MMQGTPLFGNLEGTTAENRLYDVRTETTKATEGQQTS
jgi:hypothetical protein